MTNKTKQEKVNSFMSSFSNGLKELLSLPVETETKTPVTIEDEKNPTDQKLEDAPAKDAPADAPTSTVDADIKDLQNRVAEIENQLAEMTDANSELSTENSDLKKEVEMLKKKPSSAPAVKTVPDSNEKKPAAGSYAEFSKLFNRVGH